MDKDLETLSALYDGELDEREARINLEKISLDEKLKNTFAGSRIGRYFCGSTLCFRQPASWGNLWGFVFWGHGAGRLERRRGAVGTHGHAVGQ
mgnify:CR=1 FL=1